MAEVGLARQLADGVVDVEVELGNLIDGEDGSDNHSEAGQAVQSTAADLCGLEKCSVPCCEASWQDS